MKRWHDDDIASLLSVITLHFTHYTECLIHQIHSVNMICMKSILNVGLHLPTSSS